MGKTEKRLFGFFAIGGAIFLIVGIVWVLNTFNYEGKIETVGVITRIEARTDSDGDTDHDVYVAYKADGVRYESLLGGYAASYHVGDSLDIYYDKENPKIIGNKSLDLLALIFPAMGLIFLAIGIGPFIKRAGVKRRNEKLQKEGYLVYADYKGIENNKYYSVNGRNPYNIYAAWVNPEDGETWTFKSENLWYDPSEEIRDKGIKQIPIYVDMNKKNKYFMNLDEVLTYHNDNKE